MPEQRIDIVTADLRRDEHAAALLHVLDTYAADPVGGSEPLSPATRERLIPMLREQQNVLPLLAWDGTEPVGLALGFFGLSTFAAKPLLNIHDLAVVPGMRGRGVGRALLTEAEEIAAARGCCKLTLEVQEDNLPARRLYERFGFRDFVIGSSAPTRFLSKPLT